MRMKNFIILGCVILLTAGLAFLEYLFACPFKWHIGEIIGGILFLIIGLWGMRQLVASRKKMIFSFLSGCILIVAVNVATNAVVLGKILLDACSEDMNGFLVGIVLLMSLYFPFVYIGAVWLYFYHFCGLRTIFARMKEDI